MKKFSLILALTFAFFANNLNATMINEDIENSVRILAQNSNSNHSLNNKLENIKNIILDLSNSIRNKKRSLNKVRTTYRFSTALFNHLENFLQNLTLQNPDNHTLQLFNNIEHSINHMEQSFKICSARKVDYQDLNNFKLQFSRIKNYIMQNGSTSRTPLLPITTTTTSQPTSLNGLIHNIQNLIQANLAINPINNSIIEYINLLLDTLSKYSQLIANSSNKYEEFKLIEKELKEICDLISTDVQNAEDENTLLDENITLHRQILSSIKERLCGLISIRA